MRELGRWGWRRRKHASSCAGRIVGTPQTEADASTKTIFQLQIVNTGYSKHLLCVIDAPIVGKIIVDDMGWVEEHRVEFIVEFAILETTIGGNIWRRRRGGISWHGVFGLFYCGADAIFFGEKEGK